MTVRELVQTRVNTHMSNQKAGHNESGDHTPRVAAM